MSPYDKDDHEVNGWQIKEEVKVFEPAMKLEVLDDHRHDDEIKGGEKANRQSEAASFVSEA